jgi:ketosteroid isomerase-like protein
MNAGGAQSASTAASNKRLVIDHFEDFVNHRDLAAIDRNMAADFLDHDGPGDKPTGVDGDRALMRAMQRMLPDLRVEVRDAVAEDDKVAVRNVRTATDPRTGQQAEFHGFVLWRIRDGEIAERWATVTPLHELAGSNLEW